MSANRQFQTFLERSPLLQCRERISPKVLGLTMTCWGKAAAASLVRFVSTLVLWFSYGAWAIERQASAVEVIVAMVAIIGASNGLFFTYLRTLRCPNCGIRFGSKMFATGFVQRPWPRAECWNCGAHMSEVEVHRGPFPLGEPGYEPSPGTSKFP